MASVLATEDTNKAVGGPLSEAASTEVFHSGENVGRYDSGETTFSRISKGDDNDPAGPTLSGQIIPSEKPPAPLRSKWQNFGLAFNLAVSKFWLFEVLCATLSLACLIIIVIVLDVYNGRQVPQFSYGITLPTIVSFIATIATSLLLVPVTAGLGQLKWLWFRKQRLLSDFEAVENASRGLTGSLALLWKGKTGWLALYGAFLTVAMLAIGPFVQQVVQSISQPEIFSESSIPVATIYNPPANQEEEMNMKAAIMNGLLTANTSSNQFAIQSQCPTGNCTWPSYQSLAVCSSCANITENLTTTILPVSGRGFLQLPNGVSLTFIPGSEAVAMNVTSTQHNNFSTTDNLAPVAFPNHKMALVDTFVIMYPWAQGVNEIHPYATNCIIEFCVQNYTATEINGVLNETLSGILDVPENPSYSTQSWTFDPAGVNYSIGIGTLQSIMYFLFTSLQGQEASVNPGAGQAEWSSGVTESIYVHWNQTPHNLDAMFDNMARSMTLAMRMHLGTPTQIMGQSFSPQIYVRIEWAWISLPFALFTLVVLFLFVVALATHRAGLHPWKSSNMAILFHGLQAGVEELRGLIEADSMDEAAASMLVRLRMDDGGPYLQQE